MGACCSRDDRFERSTIEDLSEKREINLTKNEYVDNNYKPSTYDNGENAKFEAPSSYVSTFSQQGRKGINQDAMTVWESVNDKKDSLFCAVIDGHGPSGHRVAQKVRDILPLKLFSPSKIYQTDEYSDNKKQVENDPFFSLWKTKISNAFEEVDQDLCSDGSFDTYCSGCTTVAILKQENHLVIANLGDSRAILCTRGETNEIEPLQLTVDLKPNLPCEKERINCCEGRVFALDEEPGVYRIWMPQDDCPGLAMARAFGDFCLKDFGLISTPEVYYKKLTENDEFLVLATDGVWDVLSNNEVIKIVASAKNRSTAARLLVAHAVRAWRLKYPSSKADDCTAICLFLKSPTLLAKSISEKSFSSASNSGVWNFTNNLKIDEGVSNATTHHRANTIFRSQSIGLSRRSSR